MNNAEILGQINKYSNMNKLTFFIGAGVSRLSGFPSWFELVKSMGDELNYNYKKTYDIEGNQTVDISQNEFLKIPQMYYVKFNKECYEKKVKSSFENNCKPNEIHDLIMSLHPNHILTTNYDTLIEECATKFGENYSVIASDKQISDAETIRYLLKVHGDFSTEFVLKESDYLNYEFSYQLISNLMKSIFATNLVVFIGYSLDDYNIRLILNWMQNTQKDKYVKPIFINTDDKKTDVEKDYYSERGICVFDSNDLSVEDSGYLEKYRNSLNAIINYAPMPQVTNKQDVLDSLYGKVAGIPNLSNIKRSDFSKMFSNDFKINDEWQVEHLNYISKADNLWKDYFDDKEEYIRINEDKCKKIDTFIKASGIRGVHTESGLYFPSIEVSDISFYNCYEEMERYCSLNYTDVKDLFKKAHYLSKIGKLAESYSMYTDVLRCSKESKCWDIYYLSQVNRYHLYKKIDNVRRYYLNPLIIVSFGKIIIIDEKFFQQMSLEMSHCNIETQFNELPYFFKCNYKFLNKFSESNCFSEEINNLLKHKYEIEKSLSSNVMTMGVSEFDKIKLDMLEAVKFIEDNMIFVQEYEESKNYIKNSMFIWLRAYDKEMNKKADNVFSYICNARLKFDLQDILLISKCCTKNDLRYFEDNINFNNIPFEEIDRLQNYTMSLIEFYKNKFTGDILMTEYLWWRTLSSEIQMLINISSYYLKTEYASIKIVEFILDCADGYWSYQDRMQIVKKYVTKDNSSDILVVLEKHFINRIQKYKEQNTNEYDIIINISNTMALVAYHWTYQFTDLSNYIVTICKEDLELIMSAMIKLSPYLSTDAKDMIIQKYRITTIWDLIEKCKVDNTIDINKHLYLIDEYFKKEINENSTPGVTIYTIPPQEKYIKDVSFFIIENDIKIDSLTNYKGHWNEFDFFFNIEDFDSDEFETDWLLYYSDKVLDYIRSNDSQLSIAKNALREMDKSKCKDHIERWLYLYSIFI